MVDDRYRLWPWSLRALAQRRGTSPGTVHKHVQALRDAGVLVDDERRSDLLVDTARLEERGRSTVSTPGLWSSGPDPELVVAGDAAEHLVGAIDALTSAVEARPDLAENLADIIGRLAQLLDNPAALGVRARDRAPETDHPARDRAPSWEERKRDIGKSSVSLSLRRARGARPVEAREGRADVGDRSREQLFELLAPLDPRRHVTYTEGVLVALARYTDDEVAYAVARAAMSPAVNPVGLLVDRANRRDPAYFPPICTPRLGGTATAHSSDCQCAGAGILPVDGDQNTYLPCPGLLAS